MRIKIIYDHPGWPQPMNVSRVGTAGRPPAPTTARSSRRPPATRRLTRAEFQGLGEVPPEAEWFANIRNAATRRAYAADVGAFAGFAGIREGRRKCAR